MTDLAYNENAVRTYERTAFVILERYNLGYNISYKTNYSLLYSIVNKATNCQHTHYYICNNIPYISNRSGKQGRYYQIYYYTKYNSTKDCNSCRKPFSFSPNFHCHINDP